MNRRLQEEVERLFKDAPQSRAAAEMKEELLANLNEKYNDFLAAGKSEEEAFRLTMESIGDIDELRRYVMGEGGQERPRPQGRYRVQREETVYLLDVSELQFDIAFMEIELLASDDASLHILQLSERPLTTEELFTLDRTRDMVSVRQGFRQGLLGLRWVFHPWQKMQIFLPDSYHGALYLKCGAGNVVISRPLKLSRVSFRLEAGSLTGGTVAADQAEWHLSAGNLRIGDADVASYRADAAAGNVEFRRLSGKGRLFLASGSLKAEQIEGECEVSVAAGNFRVGRLCASGKYTVQAGGMQVEEAAPTGETELRTSAGNISVAGFGSNGLSIEAESFAGHVRSELPLRYSRNGTVAWGELNAAPYTQLTIQTQAGNILLGRRI